MDEHAAARLRSLSPELQAWGFEVQVDLGLGFRAKPPKKSPHLGASQRHCPIPNLTGVE